MCVYVCVYMCMSMYWFDNFHGEYVDRHMIGWGGSMCVYTPNNILTIPSKHPITPQ